MSNFFLTFFLDEGWYGSGIYFTSNLRNAVEYSNDAQNLKKKKKNENENDDDDDDDKLCVVVSCVVPGNPCPKKTGWRDNH